MFLRRLISSIAVAALLSSAGIVSAHAQSAPAAPEAQIQKFGTWSTRCDESQTGAKRCHAFVSVASGEQKQSLLYLAIGYGPQDTDNDGDNELVLLP